MTEQLPLDIQAQGAEQSARDAERAEYLERLRARLKDPAFRAIEGFPVGEDEDILALSDPPYYTACPNPFLPEIIHNWQRERAELREELGLPDDSHDNGNGGQPVYHREPFATDVSEGKNDPIYNAHSYHTKVPHKAIMRYILHYTDPGDIVFDGFCGSGMTGVAAQLCGDKKTVESLGYQVKKDGTILDEKGEPVSRVGVRKSILVDLSPAATFIAYNYNTPVNVTAFEREAKRILQEVEKECGWMYETLHTDRKTKGRINYTIWSTVFMCPECGYEVVFWDVAVDQEIKRVKGEFPCPNCSINLNKAILEPSQETSFDTILGNPIRRAKHVPVLISYFVGHGRYQKTPEADDLALLRKVESNSHPHWFPTTRIDQDIDIWYERDYRKLGVYSVDAFFASRNLRTIAAEWEELMNSEADRVSKLAIFSLTGIMGNLSKMNRWPRMRGPLTGTLYIPSIYYELNPNTRE